MNLRLTPSLSLRLTPSVTLRLTESVAFRLSPSVTLRLSHSLNLMLTLTYDHVCEEGDHAEPAGRDLDVVRHELAHDGVHLRVARVQERPAAHTVSEVGYS